MGAQADLGPHARRRRPAWLDLVRHDAWWTVQIQKQRRLLGAESTAGAASWSEIKDVKPSVFGFAVAVHPNDPNTAWFVPSTKDEKRCPTDGRVVVNRTRDGGRTFETLRRGLPQEHAYDLVYRHALDVDESGDRLAFGSTTGSIWISGDAGDSW